MNSQHLAIRSLISSMAPKRAIAYIKSFELPPEEELFLIEHDVRGKSYVQIAQEHNCSVDVINAKRNKAFSKIADAINHLHIDTM